MTERPPNQGTPEYERWRRERAKRRAEELLSDDVSLDDQCGVLSGGKECMDDDSAESRAELELIHSRRAPSSRPSDK